MTKEEYDRIRAEEINIAKSVDMLYLVAQFGYTPIRRGKNYILKEHDSFVIFSATNTFCHYSQTNQRNLYKGGSTIDFCMQYANMSMRDAISYLLELANFKKFEPYKIENKPSIKNDSNPDFKIPEKNDNYKRVFAYLAKTRGIAPEVISFFMHEKRLYEEKEHHNCVFVSYDTDGRSGYASMRGTVTDRTFKGDVKGSNKEYGFPLYKPGSDKVIVFEAPIDLMSYMTLYPSNKDSLHALGCLSIVSLLRFLREHPDIKKVSFVLDNDLNAPKAVVSAKNKLTQLGYIIEEHELNNKMNQLRVKDVNEYLLASKPIKKSKSKQI